MQGSVSCKNPPFEGRRIMARQKESVAVIRAKGKSHRSEEYLKNRENLTTQRTLSLT